MTRRQNHTRDNLVNILVPRSPHANAFLDLLLETAIESGGLKAQHGLNS